MIVVLNFNCYNFTTCYKGRSVKLKKSTIKEVPFHSDF